MIDFTELKDFQVIAAWNILYPEHSFFMNRKHKKTCYAFEDDSFYMQAYGCDLDNEHVPASLPTSVAVEFMSNWMNDEMPDDVMPGFSKYANAYWTAKKLTKLRDCDSIETDKKI